MNLLWKYPPIGPLGRVCAKGLGDQGSIPGWVIPKTKKMVLDISLLNTQNYKIYIKDKVEQPRKEVHPSLHLGEVAIEKVNPRSSHTKDSKSGTRCHLAKHTAL